MGGYLKLWRPCRTPIMQQCCRAVRRLRRAVEDGGEVVAVEEEEGTVPESRHQQFAHQNLACTQSRDKCDDDN